MNRKIHVSLSALALFAVLSCNMEQTVPQAPERPSQPETEPSVLAPAFFEATLAPSCASRWEGDALLYDNVPDHGACVFTPELEEGSPVRLAGEMYLPFDMIYALYPKDAFAAFEDGKAVREVASQQQAVRVDAGYELPAVPQIAFAPALSTSLEFSPVASYLSFIVGAEGLRSLRIESVDGTSLAGVCTTEAYTGEQSFSQTAASMNIDAGEQPFEEGAEYAVEILPGKYGQGFRVNMTFEDGTSVGKNFPSGKDVARGEMAYLGELDLMLAKPQFTKVKAAFTDVRLVWNSVEGAEGYRLYVDGSLAAEFDAAVNSYQLKGLHNATNYNLRLEAYSGPFKSSQEQQITTAAVWVVEAANKGSRHATLQFDPVDNLDYNGFARCYLMEVYDDPSCTSPVYSCYPFNGYASMNAAFANSSWLGKADGDNLRYDTRVSFGSLKPATDYWFRVKAVAKVEITNVDASKGEAYVPKTLTNPYGDSDWSEPVKFTTLPAHIPQKNEIIWCDFDEMCLQANFVDGCAGTTPAVVGAQRASYAGLVACGANHYPASTPLCTYELAVVGHETKSWGFSNNSKFIDGSDRPVCVATTAANYMGAPASGSFNGWHCAAWTRPAMGVFLFDGNGTYVATPALNSPLLPDTGTIPCELSYRASALSNTGVSNNSILTYVYNGDGSWALVDTFDLPAPFRDGYTTTDFITDFSLKEHKVELQLKKGQSVVFECRSSAGAKRALIDDIRIVRK